jgi:hypothetical protein
MAIETKALHERLRALGPEERKRLDIVANALSAAADYDPDMGRVLANRLIALACLELYSAWQKEIRERE